MDKINDMILYGYECEYLDFKEKQYSKEKHVDLIADVMALANSRHDGDKFIIIGIKDHPQGKEIKGIIPDEFIDSSIYTQVILNNVEPELQMQYFKYDHCGKTLGILRVFNSDNKPYMLKKKYERLNEGFCLIRKGSVNAVAKRSDFDFMYRIPGQMEIKLLEDTLYATNDKDGCASVQILISNASDNPITILGGLLVVLNESDLELSRHPVYGIDEFVGADFKLGMLPRSEVVGSLLVGFNSSDTIRLAIDEYGISHQIYKFQLFLWDGRNNEYTTTAEGRVFADGDFLWKVKESKGLSHRFRTHNHR